jgi:hypothetical protein
MENPIMAITFNKGVSTPSIPVGKYPAKISKIGTLGTHPDKFDDGKPKPELYIEFSVLDQDTGEVRPLMKTVRLSFHEDSNLTDLIETITDDFEGKGLDQLLGLSCQIKVDHTDKGRAKVSKWYPSKDDIDLEIDPVYFDFDSDESALAKLPDWVQKKIQDSPEWAKYQKSADSSAELADALDDLGDMP